MEAYDILLELYDEKKAQILMEEVIVLNSNDALLHEWEKEKFIAYETYCATMDATKEALAKGMEKGIEQGIEQGIERGMENESNEIIKNMLSKNMDINLISEVTNKSVEEIKKIEEKMQQ